MALQLIFYTIKPSVLHMVIRERSTVFEMLVFYWMIGRASHWNNIEALDLTVNVLWVRRFDTIKASFPSLAPPSLFISFHFHIKIVPSEVVKEMWIIALQLHTTLLPVKWRERDFSCKANHFKGLGITPLKNVTSPPNYSNAHPTSTWQRSRTWRSK